MHLRPFIGPFHLVQLLERFSQSARADRGRAQGFAVRYVNEPRKEYVLVARNGMRRVDRRLLFAAVQYRYQNFWNENIPWNDRVYGVSSSAVDHARSNGAIIVV